MLWNLVTTWNMLPQSSALFIWRTKSQANRPDQNKFVCIINELHIKRSKTKQRSIYSYDVKANPNIMETCHFFCKRKYDTAVIFTEHTEQESKLWEWKHPVWCTWLLFGFWDIHLCFLFLDIRNKSNRCALPQQMFIIIWVTTRAYFQIPQTSEEFTKFDASFVSCVWIFVVKNLKYVTTIWWTSTTRIIFSM